MLELGLRAVPHLLHLLLQVTAAEMAAPQLLWEVVKGHNSFLRKNLNGAIFSAEFGNLYNKHSYKYSGACGRAVVAACEASGVVFSGLAASQRLTAWRAR